MSNDDNDNNKIILMYSCNGWCTANIRCERERTKQLRLRRVSHSFHLPFAASAAAFGTRFLKRPPGCTIGILRSSGSRFSLWCKVHSLVCCSLLFLTAIRFLRQPLLQHSVTVASHPIRQADSSAAKRQVCELLTNRPIWLANGRHPWEQM